MKISALLLAKSTSSFKHKNIMPLLGKPIMAFPMLAAINTGKIDSFYLSSDSQDYLNIAREYGYRGILRPGFLASSDAKSDDAVKHAYDTIEDIRTSDILIVQHANVATIYPGLINESIELLINDASITSVVPAHVNYEYNPYRCFFQDGENGLVPAMSDMYKMSPNRQELPIPVFLDHSFWCIRTKNINKSFDFSPWNALGNKIKPLVCQGMFDIHDEEDLRKSHDWIINNKEKVSYLW